MGVKAFVTYRGKFLLLLRDNNPDIPSPNCWSLLGGGVEIGETPENALSRELMEEANINISNPQFLFGIPDMQVSLYHVPLNDEQAINIRLGNEGQDLQFFSFEDLFRLRTSENFHSYLVEFRDLIQRLV